MSEPGTLQTAAEWIARFEAEPAERRLKIVEALLDQAHRGANCFLMDHHGRLQEFEQTHCSRT